MNLSDVKDVVTIAKPVIDPIVSAIIKPHIEKLGTWLKGKETEVKIVEHYFESIFEDYLMRTYQRLSSINILVFPNQQINIENIYYPLTLASTIDNGNKINDVSDIEFIKLYQRILISDTAGMGKSTLSKWIGLSQIKNGTSIPILIELKRLKSNHKVIDEIFNQIDPIEKKFDRDTILKFLELGSFTILFDGFDEIEYNERESVIGDIKNFISKTYNNNFFLTSRPDSALSSFGDFQIFSINPLKQKESFELIRKYDAISKWGIADKLIDEMQNKPTQIREFLINPFLVSLLYKTYSFNKDIPSKKSTFYEEVYTSLYKHHDLSKDGFDRNKKSGLDIYDFRLILRQLAFNTAKAIKVEYSYTDLVRFLKDVNAECMGIDFKEVNYIEDLEANVPLFTKEGVLFKWAHKSIQDYFAAEFISNSPDKEKIIELVYRSKKDNYLNIIDFLYELEPELFRRIVILNLISDFIEHCEKNYEKYDSEVKKKLINERQAFTYSASFGIFRCSREIDFPEARKIIAKYARDFSYTTISKTPTIEDKVIFEFYSLNFNQEILNILGKRSEPLFIDTKRMISAKVDLNILTEIPIILDHKKENIANDPKMFEKVNNLMFSHINRTRTSNKLYLLDYDKCVKLKSIIEEEIKAKKNNSLEGI